MPSSPPITINKNYLQNLSHANWISDTTVRRGGIFTADRGANLEKLDFSIQKYCSDRNLQSNCLQVTSDLKKTFEGWVLHKMQQAQQGIWQPSDFLNPKKNEIWQNDRRNHMGAMTSLFHSLYTVEEIKRDMNKKQGAMTVEEKAAIAYMKECTEKFAAKVFAGKTMNFRLLAKKAAVVVSTAEDYMTPAERRMKELMDRLSTPSAGQKIKNLTNRAQAFRDANADRFAAQRELAGTLSETVNTLSGGASGALLETASDATVGVVQEATVGRVTAWLNDVVRQILGEHAVEAADMIFKAIGLESINQFAASVTPFLGSIYSTASGISEVAQGVKQSYAAKALSNASIVKGETAIAAVEAVAQLLKNAAEENALKGARHTAVGLGRLVADAFPGGQIASTGLGIADTILDVLTMVNSYYQDYIHMKEMNEFLKTVKDPDVASAGNTQIMSGKELFAKSPLLGAYWIMIADTSSVIGICVDDLTANTFIEQVEHIVKNHLNDLRSAAADLISSSNLVVPELSAHRLILEAKTPTPHSTYQRRFLDPMYDKFRAATIYLRVEKKLPPVEWRDRIVGISSDQYFRNNPTPPGSFPRPLP